MCNCGKPILKENTPVQHNHVQNHYEHHHEHHHEQHEHHHCEHKKHHSKSKSKCHKKNKSKCDCKCNHIHYDHRCEHDYVRTPYEIWLESCRYNSEPCSVNSL